MRAAAAAALLLAVIPAPCGAAELTIAVDELPVLSAPRPGAAVKAEAFRGEIYRAVNRSGDWIKIRLEDCAFGWVPHGSVRLEDETALALEAEDPGLPREMTNGRDGSALVAIPAGEFWMGSPGGVGYEHERPRHKVHLDAYFIGRHEVTVGQFRRFAAETAREMPDQLGHGDDHPVVHVSWDDAVAYCGWAGLRLPTEAEWEKAARAGASTTYWWGDVPTHERANYTGTADRDRWDDVSPVGSFPPNPYGLHDAAGNVWEWCSDRYAAGYYAVSPARNPGGPETGQARVLRGGSWDSPADFLGSAYRSSDLPHYTSSLLGFRCARSR